MTAIANVVKKSIVLPDGTRRPFLMFDDDVTTTVCREVLNGISYPIVDRNLKINVIMDVGANVGAASVYFRAHYPKAIIHAYEPFSGSFRLLEENTAGLSVQCHEKALSDSSGPRRLYKGNIGPVGFNLWNTAEITGPEDYADVSAISAGPLIRKIDPDILKVDVEGHEWTVFGSTAVGTLSRISVIYLEYHSDWARRKIDEKLEDHVLYYASAKRPGIGELCYVKKDLVD